MTESFELYCDPFKENRRVNVYLPDEYAHTEERYPVLYMFDGHNLFYDTEATYGKSWGLKEFLDSWGKKLIVVGVYCSMHGKDRLTEYSPYNYKSRFTGFVKGTGKKTMDWYVGPLKKYIDTHYRTWWHREATAIAGSSMGGLMAYYAALRYNRYFSKAACVSPAFRLCSTYVLNELAITKPFPDTKIFMSWGTEEDKRGALEKLVHTLDQSMVEKGIQPYLYKHEGGSHCEACWEQEVPLWMQFLWL